MFCYSSRLIKRRLVFRLTSGKIEILKKKNRSSLRYDIKVETKALFNLPLLSDNAIYKPYYEVYFSYCVVKKNI